MELSILVVDDEYYICEGILSLLQSFQIPSIKEIRTCYSGESALEICQSYKPEIIITDIKMTGINGIDLIKQLSKILYPVRFLVLSGYDDYEYVRDAFQNGAVDYLLKPVLSVQLKKIILEQCHYFEQTFTSSPCSREAAIQLAGQLFSLFIHSAPDDEDEILIKKIHFCLPDTYFVFCIIAHPAEQSTLKISVMNRIYDYFDMTSNCRILCASLNKEKIGILINFPENCPELAPLLNGILQMTDNRTDCEISIALSSRNTLEHLKQLYYEAEERLTMRLHEGPGKLFNTDPVYENGELPEKLKQVTLHILRNPEVISAGDFQTQLTCHLRGLSVTELKRYYNYFTGLLRSFLANSGISESAWHFPDFYSFSSYDRIETHIHKQLTVYASCPPDLEKTKTNLDSIKDYIDKNFAGNITLAEVANRYYISYSHLSKLFHQKYGMSFQEYLICRRMTYAKQLLQSPELSIQEISLRSGYDNVFNFSRAFKKFYGLSPSHYRKH